MKTPRGNDGTWLDRISYLGKEALLSSAGGTYASWTHPTGTITFIENCSGYPGPCPGGGWSLQCHGRGIVQIDADSILGIPGDGEVPDLSGFDLLNPEVMTPSDAKDYAMILKARIECHCPNKYKVMQKTLLEKYG